MTRKKNTIIRQSRIEALVERTLSIKERVERLGLKRAAYQIQGRSRIKARRPVDDTATDTHAFHLTPRR